MKCALLAMVEHTAYRAYDLQAGSASSAVDQTTIGPVMAEGVEEEFDKEKRDKARSPGRLRHPQHNVPSCIGYQRPVERNGKLDFVPPCDVTTAELHRNWPHLGFGCDFLSRAREAINDGFVARAATTALVSKYGYRPGP